MSTENDCVWCSAYAYATETLHYSDEAARDYATAREQEAS